MIGIDWIDERLRRWARWALGSKARGLQSPIASVMALGVRVQATVDQRLVADIEAIRTERLVCALPPDLRQVVRVYYLNNRGVAWVARSVGVSSRTARDRLRRAHEWIARELGDAVVE